MIFAYLTTAAGVVVHLQVSPVHALARKQGLQLSGNRAQRATNGAFATLPGRCRRPPAAPGRRPQAMVAAASLPMGETMPLR